MDIRQLQYLVALAREKHFTRAAEACHVTQPTLSGRIRQLEDELGVPIVERGQRFHALTPEGEEIVRWARVILDSWDGMQDELKRLRSGSHEVSGHLTLGVIPSALPMAADLTRSLQEELPAVRFTVLSQSSIEIMRGLAEFAIDAGLTYLDNEPVTGLLAEPLYTERYCLFVRADHAVAGRQHVTWGEAAALPLCLLTPNMQNRRIIDKAFQHGRHDPVPRLETNSVVNLYANVRRMGLASVMPEYFLHALGPLPDIRAIPLVEPEVEHSVGLVTLPREPAPRLIEALTAAACTLRMKLKRPTLRST